MTRSGAIGAAWCAAALLVALRGHACPCRGSAGPGAALTGPLETFGANATESARVVHGSWDPFGRYAALSEDNLQYLIDVTAAVAVRLRERFELGAETAFGHQSISVGSFHSQRTGFGDTALKLRCDLADEPLPFEPAFPYVPAVGVSAALRVPTGTLDRAGLARGVASGTTGSIGSTASSQGLGAWEAALAVALSKIYADRFGIDVTGEAAYRLPDDSIGVERHLGPRALGQLTLRYLPDTESGVGLITDLGWEDAVSFAGRRKEGTAQRLWTVGVFGYFLLEPTGLRSGVMLRHAPAVDGINVNAVGATTLSVSLGYSG